MEGEIKKNIQDNFNYFFPFITTFFLPAKNTLYQNWTMDDLKEPN